MFTLAEELLILALQDDSGTVSWSRKTTIRYGLGGALLMELALQDRIRCLGGTIELVDPSPTGDEVLDSALRTIRGSDRLRDARYWVGQLGSRTGLTDQLARRLVAQGILHEQDRTLLRVFHDCRYPTTDPRPESRLRCRIRDVALGDAEPDTRTLLLLSLVNSCKLEDLVFSPEELHQARRQIKAIVEGEQFGNAIGSAIAEVAAVTTAAVSAAVFSSVVAPGASQ